MLAHSKIDEPWCEARSSPAAQWEYDNPKNLKDAERTAGGGGDESRFADRRKGEK